MVRGEGRHFCAGIDLAEVEQAESGHNPASLEGVFHRLEQLPAITIAAVHGAAIAGGLELALHCDLRIAADDAKCGMTLGKVGLMVPYDFTRKLIEVCGAANTSMILYTADLFDAKRVYEMGMMSQVVPAAELDKTVSALAEKIAGNAPLSLRAMKATVRRCMSETFDAWHQDMLDLATAVRRSKRCQGRSARVSGKAQAELARRMIVGLAERLADRDRAVQQGARDVQRPRHIRIGIQTRVDMRMQRKSLALMNLVVERQRTEHPKDSI